MQRLLVVDIKRVTNIIHQTISDGAKYYCAMCGTDKVILKGELICEADTGDIHCKSCAEQDGFVQQNVVSSREFTV